MRDEEPVAGSTGSASATVHRKVIIALRPDTSSPRSTSTVFVVDGGLLSYGPDFVDQLRRAALYVDRILKGEKPADLPVPRPHLPGDTG